MPDGHNRENLFTLLSQCQCHATIIYCDIAYLLGSARSDLFKGAARFEHIHRTLNGHVHLIYECTIFVIYSLGHIFSPPNAYFDGYPQSSMKFLFTFFALLTISIHGWADVGCAINPNGSGDGGNYIYTKYLGEKEIYYSQWYRPTYKNYSGPISLVNNQPHENPTACPRHKTSYQQAGSGGDCIIDGDVNRRGNLAYYTPINCTTTPAQVPIDDLLPFLMALTFCCALFYLRPGKPFSSG